MVAIFFQCAPAVPGIEDLGKKHGRLARALRPKLVVGGNVISVDQNARLGDPM